MVDIKKGITKKPAASESIIEFFEKHTEYKGQFYVGYPILPSGSGESITIDALWISKKYGVVIFDLVEGTSFDKEERKEEQDKIYSLIDSYLRSYTELKKNRRELAVSIEIITYAPACSLSNPIVDSASDEEELLAAIAQLEDWECSNKYYEKVISTIQSVINLKVKQKRDNVKKENSKGAIIKRLEETIATLDSKQEEAVIEFNEGLQRIRGLAGSGKTVVLALKAAYLHAQYPEWNIAVTFNTRSLKNQFKELIARFCASKKRELPDWSKIKVVNAWGKSSDGENERGIYYQACIDHQVDYLDFRSAKSLVSAFGDDRQPLEAACDKILSEVQDFNESYDAIFVDEAQDLSESFLNLCYRLLNKEKRLIYAYDELQKLNEGSPLRNPKDLFDKSTHGKRNVQDNILKRCYRNSRPLLVTAHALGFGVYRKSGLVQFFDQPQLWKDVGYEAKGGRLKAGESVKLYRTKDASPAYLENHSDIDDLIIFKSFNEKESQALWIAREIEKNIREDELLARDIIVINPIALSTKDEVAMIRSHLIEKDINSHIAGDINADVFFRDFYPSVTFTGINRAKGNEVPMVYIINAQDCYSGDFMQNKELIKRRNILFTAITRSKAWVRVCGLGQKMDELIEEYRTVKRKDFELHFTYPTSEQIKQLNIIHRDMTESEKDAISGEVNVMAQMEEIVDKIKRGDAYIEEYPEPYQGILKVLTEG